MSFLKYDQGEGAPSRLCMCKICFLEFLPGTEGDNEEMHLRCEAEELNQESFERGDDE